jgi:hypothetical protein
VLTQLGHPGLTRNVLQRLVEMKAMTSGRNKPERQRREEKQKAKEAARLEAQ